MRECKKRGENKKKGRRKIREDKKMTMIHVTSNDMNSIVHDTKK